MRGRSRWASCRLRIKKNENGEKIEVKNERKEQVGEVKIGRHEV
jgi:hypothetical protein